MTASLVTLLQLCDSLFPIGAFAHSDGLEGATASGQVATAADLAPWLSAIRDDSLRLLEGPAVLLAWRAFDSDNLAALDVLDVEVHAMRPSSSGREAMRAMGGRLMTTWQHIHRSERIAAVMRGRPSLTLPVAFGVVCGASNIGESDAVAGYAYTRLAAALSAAMRLMPVGQLEGHRLLADSIKGIPSLTAAIIADADQGLSSVRAFTPAIDIASMRQQYLHSRLFRS